MVRRRGFFAADRRGMIVADGAGESVAGGLRGTAAGADGFGLDVACVIDSAAELAATGLARRAERVPAALGPVRHAVGLRIGEYGHAALVGGVKTLAAQRPRIEIICTAREDPCLTGSDILVQGRSEGHQGGGVGSERVGEEGGGCV